LWHVEPLLGNDHEISKYVTGVTNVSKGSTNKRISTGTKNTAITDGVFSMRSKHRCYKQVQLPIAVCNIVSVLDNLWGSVFVSSYCEKLVAVAEDSSGTQRKWYFCHWKQQPSNDREDMTEH
jgi:hypothetical protein